MWQGEINLEELARKHCSLNKEFSIWLGGCGQMWLLLCSYWVRRKLEFQLLILLFGCVPLALAQLGINNCWNSSRWQYTNLFEFIQLDGSLKLEFRPLFMPLCLCTYIFVCADFAHTHKGINNGRKSSRWKFTFSFQFIRWTCYLYV